MTLEIHLWITYSDYAFQGTNGTTELKHKLTQEVCTFQHEPALHREVICISAVSTRSAYI